jgi:hypothetical protein
MLRWTANPPSRRPSESIPPTDGTDGRTTTHITAERPSADEPERIVPRLAVDGHRIGWEHRGGVKQRAMMLAAVEAVADPDPVWPPGGHKPDIAAQAAAGEAIHAASPRWSNGRKAYAVRWDM